MDKSPSNTVILPILRVRKYSVESFSSIPTTRRKDKSKDLVHVGSPYSTNSQFGSIAKIASDTVAIIIPLNVYVAQLCKGAYNTVNIIVSCC